MSLGKSAQFRAEALENGVLVFESEADFYNAVAAGDAEEIARTSQFVKSDQHPNGKAPKNAWAVWQKTIETFRSLPENMVVLHWESDQDHIHWGVTTGTFSFVRKQSNEFGIPGLVFHRPLIGGWRKTSINGVPLSNLHPKARALAINIATLNEVRTDTDYFRALLTDADMTPWHNLPEWRDKAATMGWRSKDVERIRRSHRIRQVTPQVVAIADHFDAEIKRMAATAVSTAQYANGQTVVRTVKEKSIGFTRQELEEEIADLMEQQKHRCALTDYDFSRKSENMHLKPSLDRKDSGIGYEPGNLQIVTRAANFYKSASDADDWAQKRTALEKMAIAIQLQRKTKEALQSG